MPALSIATLPPAANDIEHFVSAAEMGWLEHYLLETRSYGDLSDPGVARDFEAAWLRLERLALALGMPENSADDAAGWAEEFLRHHGRPIPRDAAMTVGTPEYRQRHIAMLWQANLWHEAIMVASGVGAIGLLFYAVAQGMRSWM